MHPHTRIHIPHAVVGSFHSIWVSNVWRHIIFYSRSEDVCVCVSLSLLLLKYIINVACNGYLTNSWINRSQFIHFGEPIGIACRMGQKKRRNEKWILRRRSIVYDEHVCVLCAAGARERPMAEVTVEGQAMPLCHILSVSLCRIYLFQIFKYVVINVISPSPSPSRLPSSSLVHSSSPSSSSSTFSSSVFSL